MFGLLIGFTALFASTHSVVPAGQAESESKASQEAAAPKDLDVLELKSGTKLRGRCEKADDHEVVFVDDTGRRLVLTWAFIRSLKRAGEDDPKAATTEIPDSYVHYRPPTEDTAGALSTRITKWAREDGVEVHLVGAIHIGETPYFQRLQRVLDQMDVVLFEGVRPAEGEEVDEDALARFDTITQLQLSLRDALGLQFQSDYIHTDRPFWINADVDLTSLQKELERTGTQLPTDNPLLGILMRLAVGSLDVDQARTNPAIAGRLRKQLAPVLAQAEAHMTNPALKGFTDVIVDFRNDAAFGYLERALKTAKPGHRIALFYGSAHLQDFAGRLRKGGWTYKGTNLIEAWTIQ